MNRACGGGKSTAAEGGWEQWGREQAGSGLEARLHKAVGAEGGSLGFQLWEAGSHLEVFSRGLI